MLFILSTNSQKPNEDKQKIIRRHVMLGKNKGKARPSKRQTPIVSCISESVGPHGNPVVALSLVADMYRSFIPARVGSDCSCSELVADVEPGTFGDIMKFAAVAPKILFPLAVLIGFEPQDRDWCEGLTYDAAYLHATIFSVEVLVDNIMVRRHQDVNKNATRHLLKSVQLLREKLLENEDVFASDSTMRVILVLAITAYYLWDHATAKKHMKALRQIVDLRGGLATFKAKKILLTLLKCDLCISLHTGVKPIFFNDPFLEPYMPYPEKEVLAIGQSPEFLRHLQMQDGFLRDVHHDLAASWLVLQRFCSLSNLAAQSNGVLPTQLHVQTMASVMYRLLDLNHFQARSVDEMIRLGILALTHHIFLQYQHLKLPYSHFQSRLERSLVNLQLFENANPELTLWTLMVAAISVPNMAEDAWLLESLRTLVQICKITSWRDLRGLMKAMIWIDVVHDKPAKDMYARVVSDYTPIKANSRLANDVGSALTE
ncbi:hypothetical protein PV08_01687 [Exophiala spinifera]|uniref:Transcription factor domain-containing protein n=1 Tax=Exophiala spinifera TaxID=91928 RepID=A0A0D2BQ89_9EURO|nr:uncharacterized protein PV08_01687 [Exophiala spinifera]KIW21108.1 hypothetical protein PV08_01687 [Exophiala spinifera]